MKTYRIPFQNACRTGVCNLSIMPVVRQSATALLLYSIPVVSFVSLLMTDSSSSNGSGINLVNDNLACRFEGDVYMNGDVWWHSACTKCNCMNTIVSCVTEDCVPLKCSTENQIFAPGACCPECRFGK